MNGEERNIPETSQEPRAGEGSFERSENEPSPATTAAGHGMPPQSPPVNPTAGGIDPDEPWDENPWPRVPQPTDEGAHPPDSTSYPSPTPNLKARRRGTYAPAVERPVMPLSPQQRLLLLDTWQRSGLPARD